MIVMKTSMQELPANCQECKLTDCSLPMKNNGYEVHMRYTQKRHRDCRLRRIPDGAIPGETSATPGE